MSVQTDSFQTAWQSLSSPGLDPVRACFEIGWDLAHLTDAVTALMAAANSGPSPAPDPGPKQPANREYLKILEVSSLSPGQDRQLEIVRIGSALSRFTPNVPSEVPVADGLSAQSLAADLAALAGAVAGNDAVDAATANSALVKFHVDMVEACAATDGTAAAGQAAGNGAGATVDGLQEAYEVGRLLAALVLEASGAETGDSFRGCLSIDPGSTPPSGQTPAFRAHALLGGLRERFPSGAAYSVARHLEDWSDWVNGKAVDNAPRRFKDEALAASQRALLSQGAVWRAMLSGQAAGRDYLVATSYADAANRLFVSWSASATAIARAFLRSALGRLFLLIGIVAVLLFAGAFLFDLLTTGAVTSGAKTGVTITAIVAALISAGGIFHIGRAQVASALGDVWAWVEAPMVEAELLEAIVLSTRRLPADSVAGASAPQAKTMGQRLRRARRGSLS